MTGIAVLGKPRSHVIGRFGFGELPAMAAEAVHRRSRKTGIGMTGLAVHPRVGALKREAGKLSMVESGAPKGVDAVARFAACRQFRGDVIQRAAPLIILLMTGVAVGIQTGVNTARGAP